MTLPILQQDQHDTGASASAENWRGVAGHPDYIVSSEGRVRRLHGERILRGDVDRYGYQRVLLNGTRRKVHRLVCEAFHGAAPTGHEVCHLDGDRRNNRAANLMWGTRSDNVRHSVAHGTHSRGIHLPPGKGSGRGMENPTSKLTDDKVRAIRAFARAGRSERAIAQTFEISPSQTHKIISREAWAHVQD